MLTAARGQIESCLHAKTETTGVGFIHHHRHKRSQRGINQGRLPPRDAGQKHQSASLLLNQTFQHLDVFCAQPTDPGAHISHKDNIVLGYGLPAAGKR